MHIPPTSVLIATAISLLLKGARARPAPLDSTLQRIESSSPSLSGQFAPAIHRTTENHPTVPKIPHNDRHLVNPASPIHLPPPTTNNLIDINKRAPQSTTSLPPYPMHTDPADTFRRPPIDIWFPHHPDRRYAPDFDPRACQRHTDGGDWPGDYWGHNRRPHWYPTVGQFVWSSQDCAKYFNMVGNGWYDGGSIGGKEGKEEVGRDWVRPDSWDYQIGWGDYRETDKDKDYKAWVESQREWREGEPRVRDGNGGFVIGEGGEGGEKEW